MIDQEITGKLMGVARNDWLGWEENLAKQISALLREHDQKIINGAIKAIEQHKNDMISLDTFISDSWEWRAGLDEAKTTLSVFLLEIEKTTDE